jgi:phosphoribosylformimino-5-aminoimidazole carboxamide ribotide isomerase
LRQGKSDDQTTYSDDPAAIARKWKAAGAEWIHVVDLDGAFGGEPANMEAIRAILGAVDVPIEVGGGIRTIGAAVKLVALGVARVILGTVAVTNPEIVKSTVDRLGAARVVVGLDAKNSMVAVRGWTEASTVSAMDLAKSVKELGVARIVYTDIHRDGMFSGPNVDATAAIAMETGLAVIASGGVGSLADVIAVAAREADGIEGVIIGKALYDGAFALEEALLATRRASTQTQNN